MNYKDCVGMKLVCMRKHEHIGHYRWSVYKQAAIGKEMFIKGTDECGNKGERKYFVAIQPDLNNGNRLILPIECFDWEQALKPAVENKGNGMKKEDVKIGMKVVVARKLAGIADDPGWVGSMDKFVGNTYVVEEIRENYPWVWLTNENHNGYWFHVSCLEPASGKKKKEKMKIGDKVVCYRKGGEKTCWICEMNYLLEKKEEGEIIEESKDAFDVKFKEHQWFVPKSCLKKV